MTKKEKISKFLQEWNGDGYTVQNVYIEKECADLMAEYIVKLFAMPDVSHINTPNYLDDKDEGKCLINNTYQVEQNGNCVYQGSESDCNEWLKCQLGCFD